MVASEPEDGGGRLSVRLLVVALVAQLVLFGGLIALAVNGFPMIGGGGDRHETRPAATAGGAVPAARANRFDGSAAMGLARLQLGYGPRPAGSPQLRRLAGRLRRLLPHGRFEDLPADPGMRNVVGSLPGRGPGIVLGAHYETRNRPRGFVGANDSAAGTAVLVQAARTLARLRRPANAPEIRFVLFDGEEELRPTNDFFRDALRGSKAYVQAHAEEVGAMILLDYVGNRGLRLPREGTSDRTLWERVRRAARRVGVGAVFPPATQTAIIDDHTPFLRAGIPAVDLIDWSYPYTHTLRDNLRAIDQRSLDAVGETIVELLRTWR